MIINNFINNPLEQFLIIVLKKITVNDLDISITNNTVVLFCIALFFFVFFYCLNFQNYCLISPFNFYLEKLYNFVIQLTKQQVGSLIALRYFPLVFFIFIFILLSNLIGLLPYGFTITGHIIITFQIAFSVFFGITIINIVNNQSKFFNLFVPSGVPLLLIPFLVVVEIASYLIRPFSLSVRLFANMLAGHTLLNILSAFVFNVFKGGGTLLAIFPLFFIIFIVGLEIGIALVQAYIFIILILIYLNDVYASPH